MLAVINKEIHINNKKKKEIVEKLREMKFDPIDPKAVRVVVLLLCLCCCCAVVLVSIVVVEN